MPPTLFSQARRSQTARREMWPHGLGRPSALRVSPGNRIGQASPPHRLHPQWSSSLGCPSTPDICDTADRLYQASNLDNATFNNSEEIRRSGRIGGPLRQHEDAGSVRRGRPAGDQTRICSPVGRDALTQDFSVEQRRGFTACLQIRSNGWSGRTAREDPRAEVRLHGRSCEGDRGR